VRQRYEGNFARLLEGLRPVLVGCREVYTHNPWGEYGHAEHIQVYRAVTALQDELGYTVWFSNYVGPRNFTYVNSVAGHLSWTRRSVVAPDVVTARTLMRVYRGHRAWTWTSGHRWPEHEVMYAHPPGSSSEPRRPFSGEWLLDTQALRSWLTRWRRPWRLLDPVHQRRAQRPFD
jgi:LmbE family N-acetylglucosaminyl deacetylase